MRAHLSEERRNSVSRSPQRGKTSQRGVQGARPQDEEKATATVNVESAACTCSGEGDDDCATPPPHRGMHDDGDSPRGMDVRRTRCDDSARREGARDASAVDDDDRKQRDAQHGCPRWAEVGHGLWERRDDASRDGPTAGYVPSGLGLAAGACPRPLATTLNDGEGLGSCDAHADRSAHEPVPPAPQGSDEQHELHEELCEMIMWGVISEAPPPPPDTESEEEQGQQEEHAGEHASSTARHRTKEEEEREEEARKRLRQHAVRAEGQGAAQLRQLLREAGKALQAPWPLGQPNKAPPGVPLHWATIKAMQELQPFLWQAVSDVTVYFDGAYAPSNGAAGWAAALLCRHHDGSESLLDVAYGPVCYDPACDEYVGASSGSSYSAEVSAMAWGLLLLAKAEIPPWAPARIVGDNVAALICADHATAKAQLEATTYARAIAALVQTQRWLSTEHVKGHSNHPWNELCDRMAGTAAATSSSRHGHIGISQLVAGLPSDAMFPGNHFAATKHTLTLQWTVTYLLDAEAKQWPMLHEQNEHGHQKLHPDLVALVLQGEGAQAQANRPVQRAARRCRTDKPSSCVRVATANVLTLDGESRSRRTADDQDPEQDEGKPCGLLVTGRMKSLLKQMETKQLHIVGVQETRRPQPQVGQVGSYYCISSAKAAGKGGGLGCDLWINTELPFATTPSGKEIKCSPTDVTVKAATDRIIVAHLEVSGLSLDILVALAPHAMVKEEIREQWWQELQDTVQACRTPGAHLIALADFNSRVGSESSSHIGTWQAEQQNDNGRLLHHFLKEQQMALPATFEKNFQGDSLPTWRGPNGATGRIDYVAVDSQLLETTCSGPDASVDLSIARVDHILVTASCKIPHNPAARAPRRRRPLCAMRELQDDEKCATFEQHMRSMPPVPAWVNPDDHHQMVTAHIARGLKEAFPAKPQPRKEWIPEHTWEQIQEKARQNKIWLRHPAWARKQLMRHHICRWRGEDPDPSPPHEQRRHTQALLAAARSYRLQKEIRVGLKQAKLDLITNTVAEATQAYEAGQSHRVHKAFKALQKWKPRPLPVVKFRGEVPRTTEDMQKAWGQHLMEQHDGVQVNLEHCVAQHRDTVKELEPLPAEKLAAIPTLFEVESLMKAGAKGRACGPDGVPPGVIKRFAHVIAPAVAPLYAKSASLGTEPIRWKGGSICYFPKPASRDQEYTSQRVIVLADQLGKTYRLTIRNRMNRSLAMAARDLQCGGIGGKATDFATHSIRTWVSLAARRGQSLGVLFVDFRTAFYSILRTALLGSSIGEGWPELMQRLGVPLTDPDLQPVLQLIGALDEIQVDSAIKRRTVGSQMATWLQLEGGTAPYTVMFRQGVLPGDTIADMLFNIVMVRLLRKVAEKLQQQELLVETPQELTQHTGTLDAQDGQLHNEEASYMDDLAYVTMAQDPAQIPQKIAAIAGTIFTVAKQMGLELNFKRGKTEGIADLRGAGSRAARHQLFIAQRGLIEVPEAGANLIITASYKHLGGQICPRNNMDLEVRYRSSAAQTAYSQLRTGIFAEPRLPAALKLQARDTFVESRLLHNAAVWPPLSSGQVARLSACHMRTMRAAAGIHYTEGAPTFTDQEVQAIARQPGVDMAIRICRLRYVQRLMLSGPTTLRLLLEQEQTWLDTIHQDIKWVAAMAEPAWLLQALDDEDPASVLQAVARAGRSWRTSLRKALKAHLDSLGDDGPPAPQQVVPFAEGNFVCYQCGEEFRTRAALGAHSAYRHQLYSDPAVLAEELGSVCPACLQDYGNPARLRRHLERGSPHCLELLRAHVLRPGMSEARPARRKRTLNLETLPAVCPVHRVHGPQPAWATAPGP